MANETWMFEIRTSQAIDAPLSRRPGVPQRAQPAPAGDPPYFEPSRQFVVDGLVKDAQRDEWTATFGTGQPPRGLSGAMRRVAYAIPDYRIRRWALLLAADRVDGLEHRVARAVKSPAAWASLLVALSALGAASVAVAHVHHARRARAERPLRWLRAIFA